VELKEGKAHVIEAACKGCGICTAECPEGAMQLRHFKDNQIAAVVEAVLGG
jgi:heterodisulfide reductase subunit A